jgi:hypothetical protein
MEHGTVVVCIPQSTTIGGIRPCFSTVNSLFYHMLQPPSVVSLQFLVILLLLPM